MVEARTQGTVVQKTRSQLLAECVARGHFVQSVDCWQCGGEGFSHHDCGEDCCACLYPEDNVRCDICYGKGGYRVCLTCHPDAADG